MIEIYSNNKNTSNAHLERQRKENGGKNHLQSTFNTAIQNVHNIRKKNHKKKPYPMVNNNAKLALLWHLDITAKYNKSK